MSGLVAFQSCGRFNNRKSVCALQHQHHVDMHVYKQAV